MSHMEYRWLTQNKTDCLKCVGDQWARWIDGEWVPVKVYPPEPLAPARRDDCSERHLAEVGDIGGSVPDLPFPETMIYGDEYIEPEDTQGSAGLTSTVCLLTAVWVVILGGVVKWWRG
jgi:hypothetical protein